MLRPGGHLLYADFRFNESVGEWEKAFASAPLKTLSSRKINGQVLRGLDRNSGRSLELVRRHLPKLLRPLGRDFAGIEGSRISNALRSGELSYRSACLRKE